MLLSINWLKEFIDLNVPLEDIAEKLSVSGTEIESISRPCENVKGVRIAKIAQCSQHPTKSGLKVTRLDVGEGEFPLCVTAAPNVKQGDVIPWFAPGSSTIEGVTLGYRDFDGFNSAGMMCSAKELGVPDLTDVFGILQLPQDAPLGADAGEWLGLNDTVFDVSVTPNRGDLLSVLGMALEIHALFPQCTLHLPKIVRPQNDEPWTLPFDGVSIETEGCLAYRLGLADNVHIKPSPLQAGVRLCMSGMRPLNNIVDATNYAMLALGQPQHAFDARSLPASDIGVRLAREGEEIVTLDGKTCALLPSDMVISSGGKGVALAGVMGGLNSEITDATQHVLLETAHFTSPFISKTSRRLGIPSEAAFRYARGVDPAMTEMAMNYTLSLMEQWGGARAFARNFYAENGKIQRRRVKLTAKKMKRILCCDDLDEATQILHRLGIERESGNGDEAFYIVPTRRTDIAIEEDLIEEVGRIRGYESIAPTIPVLHQPGALSPVVRLQRLLRSVALARGYTEVITLSFISPAMLQLDRYPYARQCKTVANPISVDMSVMRPSLLPGLLSGLSKTLRGGWRDPVHVFEFGRVFVPENGKIREVERIGGIAFTGKEKRALYSSTKDDFMLVKGDVEALAQSCNVKLTFRQSQRHDGHAGQTAEILLGDRVVGYLMALKPDIAAQFDISTPLYAFELDVESFLDAGLPRYGRSAAYPPVYRDVSMLVSNDVNTDAVLADIRACGGQYLSSIRLFDVYEGQGVPEGFRSMAFSMAYRQAERTLRDDEVDEQHNALRAKLETKGYTLR
ncbi:MAG: phenylalanine--tRNA ligase subunit beta [Pyramidobacter sp.]|jgi:phenylalanyl-tRNA synthetase beta chain